MSRTKPDSPDLEGTPEVFKRDFRAEPERRKAAPMEQNSARDAAEAEIVRAKYLHARLAERDDLARDEAFAQLARTNAELERRLAQRTIERDDVARDEALAELARTNEELERRLAERTVERDDVARDEALAEQSRAAAELEARLAERTIERDGVAKDVASAELTRTNAAQDQLRVHTVELEEVNAELESFSYSVSHDLRAPVRAVLGYIRAIQEDHGGELSDEGRRLLGVVEKEASRMGNLIDDLLAFSRLGRASMSNAVVDMTALAREAMAEHVHLPGHERAVEAIPVLPPARGDRTLLRQVWVNLISNAVKYAGKKAAPAVRVWAATEGSTTTYFVQDNGVGFDMRYASKLFGVFQRLHRMDEFPGTGVGLAIVMRIVKRHGGDVRADAQLGEGATFSFTLPRVSVP
jgi:signal transduction histidine kinase